MSLKHGILGLLNYGAMSGYELNTSFRDSLAHFWKASISQIYRELYTMQKSGWVQSEEIIQSGKPNKKLYSLTAEGNRELSRWLTKTLDESDLETRSSFLMKIFFAAGVPRELAIRNLTEFQALTQAALTALINNTAADEYAQYASHNDEVTFWKLTADFGQRYHRMCLEWAEAAINTIPNCDSDQGDNPI